MANPIANNEKELTAVALTSSQCHQLMATLHSHTLGSQPVAHTGLDNLGTHQVTTVLVQSSKPLTSQSSKPSVLPDFFNSIGNESISTLESSNSSSMTFCLQSLVILDHSVFSSNLIIPSNITSNDWIIDSGAIEHMVHSITLLTKVTSIAHISIKLPNGEFVFVTHIGQVQLSSDLILDNVLCVPFFFFQSYFYWEVNT